MASQKVKFELKVEIIMTNLFLCDWIFFDFVQVHNIYNFNLIIIAANQLSASVLPVGCVRIV